MSEELMIVALSEIKLQLLLMNTLLFTLVVNSYPEDQRFQAGESLATELQQITDEFDSTK